MSDYTVGKIENLGEAMGALDETEEGCDLDKAKAYVLDTIQSGNLTVKQIRQLAETYAILCSTEYYDD